MSPATIIIQATADGVRLALSATGTIKATGEAAVVNRWLPLIREHKVDIISELQAAANDAVQIWPDLPVDRSIVTACPDCQHFARPGLSAGYCGVMTFPWPMARTIPCDSFPRTVGPLVAHGRQLNERKENEHGNH